MNVDPSKLVRHFRSSIGNGSLSVNGRRMYPCPLHADPDMSLSVGEGANPVFSCSNPGCRFRGDAVALVALARKIDIDKAIDLFRPGGEFANCLDSPLSASEAEAYLESGRSQARLRAYLSRCRQALRRTPERYYAVPGLSRATARLLHPDAGMFVPDGVPECLSEFSAPAYRNSCLLLHPYTMDGEVVRIDVVDARDPVFRRSVVVSHPCAGVFGEDAARGLRKIVAMERPEAVVALHAAYAKGSVGQFPAVALQGWPLPESLADVYEVTLLSTRDCPLSDELLVDTLSASASIPAHVRVSSTDKATGAITSGTLANIISGATGFPDEVQVALAKRLAVMAGAGRGRRVLELLSGPRASRLARSLVLDAAKKLPHGGTSGVRDRDIKDLVDILSSAPDRPAESFTLANGREVARGPASLDAVLPGGVRTPLCNVGLSVSSRMLRRGDQSDGGEYVCTASHACGAPSVVVRLAEADLTPDRLRRAVSRAFAEKGFTPYVAFYSVPGYRWRDVVARLSENCPVSWGVDRLGVDSSASVNFPSFRLLSDGSSERQPHSPGMSDQVLSVYSGLPFNDMAGVEPYSRLFARCGEPGMAAFALGLAHVVYQATYALRRPECAGRRMRHLFYVSSGPGDTTAAAFKALSSLLSGDGFSPEVPYRDPDKYLNRWKGLGCLPLVAMVPSVRSGFASALDASGIGMIGLVDDGGAAAIGRSVPASFVRAGTEEEVPGPEELEKLRASFMAMLSKVVKSAPLDGPYRSAAVPCLAALSECFHAFGLEIPETPASLVGGCRRPPIRLTAPLSNGNTGLKIGVA